MSDQSIREQLQRISGLDLLEHMCTSPEILRQLQNEIIKHYVLTHHGKRLSAELGTDDQDKLYSHFIAHLSAASVGLPSQRFCFSSEYDPLLNHPGFEPLLALVEGTKNVNRSNISAVLAVAARNSAEMNELIELMNEHFNHDSSEISNFFKEYLEKVKGWKFNKFNRKEEESDDRADPKDALSQLARILLQSSTEDPLLRALECNDRPIYF